ncbi:unnamed protein product, partial [Notodromas monacha]
MLLLISGNSSDARKSLFDDFESSPLEEASFATLAAKMSRDDTKQAFGSDYADTFPSREQTESAVFKIRTTGDETLSKSLKSTTTGSSLFDARTDEAHKLSQFGFSLDKNADHASFSTFPSSENHKTYKKPSRKSSSQTKSSLFDSSASASSTITRSVYANPNFPSKDLFRSSYFSDRDKYETKDPMEYLVTGIPQSPRRDFSVDYFLDEGDERRELQSGTFDKVYYQYPPHDDGLKLGQKPRKIPNFKAWDGDRYEYKGQPTVGEESGESSPASDDFRGSQWSDSGRQSRRPQPPIVASVNRDKGAVIHITLNQIPAKKPDRPSGKSIPSSAKDEAAAPPAAPPATTVAPAVTPTPSFQGYHGMAGSDMMMMNPLMSGFSHMMGGYGAAGSNGGYLILPQNSPKGGHYPVPPLVIPIPPFYQGHNHIHSTTTAATPTTGPPSAMDTVPSTTPADDTPSRDEHSVILIGPPVSRDIPQMPAYRSAPNSDDSGESMDTWRPVGPP